MANKKASSRNRNAQPSVGPVLAGIVSFGLAALLFYIAVTRPEAGTAMGTIKGVLKGVGGSVACMLPLIFVWIGVLCVKKGRGRRVSVWRTILDAILIVCGFTAVELFFAAKVAASGISGHVYGYFDFIAKAYNYSAGGGALGAFAAWPLYKYVGAWGGVIVLVVAALLILAMQGRLTALADWLGERSEISRERREEEQARREEVRYGREQRRLQRAQERLLNAPAAEDDEPFRPVNYEGAEHFNENPGRGKRRTKSAARGENARPAAEARVSADFDDFAGDKAAPRERIFRSDRVEQEDDSDRSRESRLFEERRAERASRRRGKRLFAEENTDEMDDSLFEVNEPEPGLGQQAAKKSRKKPVIQPAQEDDFDEEGVEPGIGSGKKGAKKARRGSRKIETEAFSPDESYEHNVQEEPEDDDLFHPEAYGDEPKPENLHIEPDEYEKPEEDSEDDEPPFDMPDKGAKKPLGKLKRVETPAEEEPEPYNYPPLDLLPQGSAGDDEETEHEDMRKARLLEDTQKSFGISTKLTGIAHGPAVTRFELQPAAGVKVSRITSLADDIALNLAATRVRIEAPIPGKAAVGVELPNDKVESVPLRNVLESSEARKHPSRIAVGLGKDNSGRYIVADVAKMPHVLIAGQTGSGKSVCINSLIVSILYRATPDEVKLILIDPKVVELSVYNDIPHLIAPVVTDPKKAASALEWAVTEMEGRYKKFAERGVRNIKGYNSSLKEGEKPMPQMVIIIDELADLMMVAPGEVEDSICRLAQLARAAGMHLVIATQRPSVNVITGIIKANIPTRIAFLVASQVDSRTIIDHAGAEKLLGYGDMLFVPSGAQKSIRVQGAWVSDEEVNAVVEYIKSRHETVYDEDVVERINNASVSDAEKEEILDEYDPRLPEAVEIVIEAGQASISMLQRRMRVGYARAGRLIDEMAQRGIVSEADGAKPRAVLITRDEFQRMFEEDGSGDGFEE